ncbi:hypothetical protein [Amycolatopsis magusensis]|uniref:hypothetical protein n=1 Tax=Amycolatopsis magusensis TaxID=882444 RepID=UPI00379EF0BF
MEFVLHARVLRLLYTVDRPATEQRGEAAMPDEDFDAFFHREFPRVVGFLISLGFGSGLAEDSAAEAILKAHTKWCELHQPRA